MSCPDSESWKVAKAQGDAAERAIAEWFRSRGYTVMRTIGEESLDLQLQCSIEVKNDLVAQSTRKAAIEVEYRGEPSGIKKTQAAWWAIAVGDKAHLVKSDELLRLVVQGNYPRKPAGDSRRAIVVLVPLEHLENLNSHKLISIQHDATH